MPLEMVYVVLGTDGQAIEILKNSKAAAGRMEPMASMPRKLATGQIRRKVFTRDGWSCTHCGAPVTWVSGQMHERVWRGRGGEISVENSTTLCPACHQKDPVAGHGKRAVQWS